jgi:hypothetical protein
MKLWPILIFIIGLIAWLLLTITLALLHSFDLATLSLGLGVSAVAISSVFISLTYRRPNVSINFKTLYFSVSVLSVGAAMYLIGYLIESLGVIRNLAFVADLIGIAVLFFVVRRTPKL